jgi:hypothetical protein
VRDTLGIEIVIQLCRMQIQREREKLAMTPKMAGALAVLKKLRSDADDVADRITRRVVEETSPALLAAEKGAHGSIDKMHTVIDDIDAFTEALKSSNGGDPLDLQDGQSDVGELRSSDVAALRAVK